MIALLWIGKREICLEESKAEKKGRELASILCVKILKK